MPYKVYKIHDDRRNHTCGFVIPNGGWYHIVEMRFENYKQLCDIGNFPGYSVDYVEGNIGMYDPDGNQIDPATIEIDSVSKMVLGYETINKTRAGKETPVKSNIVDTERDALINECARKGINIDKRWSTQRIKETMSQVNRFHETTLAAG